MKNIHYISAGAGSGKTYELTHILVNLIKEGKTKPQEIIMTTFTDKAAAELRQKAREVLCGEGLFEKVAQLDLAVIGTVHSVGYSFVNKYWYRIGINAKLSVMSDEERSFYINQSLADIIEADDIDDFRRLRDEFNVQCKSDYGAFVNDYDFWKPYLCEIIEKALGSGIIDMGESVRKSKEMVRATLCPDGSQDFVVDKKECSAMANFVYDLARNNDDKKRLEAVERYTWNISWCIDDVNRFIKYLAGLPKINYKNRYPKINDFIQKYAVLWHSEEIVKLFGLFIDRVFNLVNKWLEQYEKYKRAKSIIDYNDMEQYFLRLLDEKDIADEISGRYKYVFVDEFQDCNPVQVKIFDKLSDYVESSYWVGDGKQAIYGFRGTDTRLTDSVADIIAEDEGHFHTLDTSYRSLPNIVYANNRFFTSVFHDHFKMMDADKIELKKKKESKGDSQQLEAWYVDYGNQDCLAQAIAQKIALMIADGEKPDSIAVLARTKNHCDKVASHLYLQNISVDREGCDTLASRKETVLLTSILSLIVDRYDELAKAQIAFLTTPNMELEALIDNRLDYLSKKKGGWMDDNPLVKAIEERREELSVLPVVAMVESVIVGFDLFSVVSHWGDERVRKTNLEGLIAIARQYEQRCDTMVLCASVTDFINYVSSSRAVSTGDSEGVFVGTYHAAKGLQWKTVILVSLDNDIANEKTFIRKNIFGVHLENCDMPSKENLYPDKSIILLPLLFGNGDVPEDINDAIRSLNCFGTMMDNYLCEEARLMYVGMTRAEEKLVLTVKKNSSLKWLKAITETNITVPTGGGDCDILGIDLPFKVISVLEEESEAIHEHEGIISTEEEKEVVCSVVSIPSNLYVPDSELRFQSPSTMKKTSAKVVLVHDFKHRIGLHGEQNIRTIGNCIHGIFCVLRHGDSEANRERATTLIDSYGMTNNLDAGEVVIAFENYLTKMKELYGEPEKIYHELEFSYAEKGSIVRGSMDLVYVTREGCILTDFKTNPEGCRVLDRNDEHYAGKYNTQFSCYMKALEKTDMKVKDTLVFYPVSGLIVRLEVN